MGKPITFVLTADDAEYLLPTLRTAIQLLDRYPEMKSGILTGGLNQYSVGRWRWQEDARVGGPDG